METQNLIILDFGSQYTQLIGRRCRELGVFSLILPYDTPLEKIRSYKPLGIVLSGGPSSVNDPGAPKLDKKLLGSGIPVLGICYGLQLFAYNLGGEIGKSKTREYGLGKLKLEAESYLIPSEADGSPAWMSHGDHVNKMPEGFKVTATSQGIITAAEDENRKLFGLQFHPEVTHTRYGKQIYERFLRDICGYKMDWTPEAFIDLEVGRIKKLVGNSKVICALSGGVDSSVAAALVNKAIGRQQVCVFVDTGLLRANEFDEVLAAYEKIDLNVRAVKAEQRFLGRLKSVVDPEQKRKIIGDEFIRIFEEEAARIDGAEFLVQGTLYPDVIESVSVHGPSVTIKSHHNVGGLPEKMSLKLIEPLRELFKDEVRKTGTELGLPDHITNRQPFPGPGLAVRIIGEVNEQSTTLLKAADAIVREEIDKHKIRGSLWQFFAVLLPIKSVGVMGDGRTYEQVIAIRVVESVDGMTADWAKLPYDLLETISNRVVREVKGVNRVVYDVTSKPPGTIEWE